MLETWQEHLDGVRTKVKVDLPQYIKSARLVVVSSCYARGSVAPLLQETGSVPSQCIVDKG